MENKKTEIDIILPNYNSFEFIDKTIQRISKTDGKIIGLKKVII